MTYVTLCPNSNSNKTGKHQVVEFEAWRAYVDGDTAWYPAHSEHDTAAEAKEAADRLNAEELAKVAPN